MIMPAIVLKQRVIAAIRGAFIAEAASMPTHWIYDPKELRSVLQDPQIPEFRDPPSPKFYSAAEFPGHYERIGMLSPYGEQLLFVTEYVAKTMSTDFNGAEMSKAMLEWAKSFGGRPDQALNQFVENMKKEDKSGQWPNCGADDDQGKHC